jgi:hypothetical protein
MQSQVSMDNTISYKEAAALVANPPSLAPCPNFTDLPNLTRHIQRVLQRLSCPRATYWDGRDLSWLDPCIASSHRHRSGFLLTWDQWRYITHPQWKLSMRRAIPSSTWQETPHIMIYLTSPERRNQVSMRNSNEQKNYYEVYLNIRRVVFNILDDNIDDVFKVSNDPMLVGWNPLMEP